MAYLAGKIVLSIVAGAPNNGKGQQPTETPVKKATIRGRIYPYVSAQAFRRWWRDSITALGAEPSPVVRVGKAQGKAQKATTQGDPIRYVDDDLFGYMKASPKGKGKADGEAGTTVRDSPLMVGTFLSVEPARPTPDFGVMARGVDDPVLHSHEFYTADLAAPFLLDVPRVGTFTLPSSNGSGRANYLSEQEALSMAAAVQAGATACTFRGQPALRLPLEMRRERVAVLLDALAELTGGAKKALHYGDRVPALIALVPMAGGVNPLGFVIDGAEEEPYGLQVRARALRDELAAWHGEWEAPVRLGWRPGFPRSPAKGVRDRRRGPPRLRAGHHRASPFDAAQPRAGDPGRQARHVVRRPGPVMPVQPQRTPIDAVRIELFAPVASFRDPMFPGVSRCLAVPPPATIRGMFAAVTGNPAEPVVFGMSACADGHGVDAETYHPIAVDGSNPAVRGRVREGKGGMTVREHPFLAGVRVTLWIPEPDGGRIARALRRPVWGLRLGRSQDLVYVRNVTPVTLHPAERAVVGHALAPVGGHASARAALLRLANQVSLDRLRATYGDYLWCAEPGGWETVRGAYRDGDQAVWLHSPGLPPGETAELMQILAKSAANSPLGRSETLAEHSLQARRAADHLAERIGSPGLLAGWPDFWSWVRTAALLHDAGKIAEGFQRQLRPSGEPWGERHEVLSLAFVHLLTRHLPERDRQMIAAGVVFHHHALTGEDGLASRYPPEADWEAKFGLNRNAAPGRPRIQVPLPRRAAVLDWFARELGVEAPAGDRKLWELARDAFEQVRTRWSGEVTPEEGLLAVLLQGAVVLADRSASAHVPLRTGMPLPRRYVATLARPYPHQVKASEHVGHLIVRAPTGSGKTETGLCWASRQLDDMPGRPRLVWLLPYRASIDAARLRFIEDLGADPDEIAILHATAAQSLLAECVGDDGHAGREQARKAKAQRAAMRLYSQRIRVATPHQLLRAALAGPAHSAGFIEQANALMVLDELHAYDPVVFGRICAAMRLWTRLGSRVCVLSATLAQPMVDLVRESLGPSPVEIVDAPHGVAPDRHRLVLDEEPIDSPASLDRIRGWLAEGHGVLVVANTVARAQQLYRELRPAALQTYPGDTDAAILLHSRFRHQDRAAIERRIRARYPERDERGGERRGGLVVATQVLEVSLCLDFDRGVSELAPVEAIAQRAGRVNRRGCHPDGVVEFRVHLDVEAWPYEQAALDAARLALTEHPGPIISEQTIDAWLKTAYATEWGRAWETKARQSRDTFDQAFLTFTTPFHDRAEFADKLARELDSVEVLHHEDIDRYRELEAEDPLLAHRLLIPMRYLSAVRYGTYNRRLRMFEIAMPYSPEMGLSAPLDRAGKITPPVETIL